MRTKKILFALAGAVLLFGFTAIQDDANCNIEELRTKCGPKLDPYNYDVADIITAEDKEEGATIIEREVVLFFDETYRAVFNIEGYAKKLNINVYNKSKKSKERQAIFSNKDKSENDKQFVLEVPKSRKIYIEYELPVGHGCVFFMLGYK